MADVVASPTSTHPAAHGGAHSRDHHSPVTPGKVAMWLFLATEVMFFTGLIGSYIVLRSGSSSTAYSNLYSPTTSLTELKDTYGVAFKSESANAASVEEAIKSAVPDITRRGTARTDRRGPRRASGWSTASRRRRPQPCTTGCTPSEPRRRSSRS